MSSHGNDQTDDLQEGHHVEDRELSERPCADPTTHGLNVDDRKSEAREVPVSSSLVDVGT